MSEQREGISADDIGLTLAHMALALAKADDRDNPGFWAACYLASMVMDHASRYEGGVARAGLHVLKLHKALEQKGVPLTDIGSIATEGVGHD